MRVVYLVVACVFLTLQSVAQSSSDSSGLVGMPSVQAFGAKGDTSTDNTAAIRAAIASLAPIGGTVYFPPAAGHYNFGSTIVIPRNVTIKCLAPDAVTLQYTGTTAAFVWADSNGTTNYNRGGMRDCTLAGNGMGSIGIYSGGDPAGVISPSSAYGDFLTFFNDKISGFSVGYQLGNNSWENNFISTLFTSNTLGWYIAAAGDSGENVAMHGGSIQNGTNAIINYNVNSDVVLDSVSIDGMSGSAIISGNAATGTRGGTIELNSPHIEYFSSSIPSPLFVIYGDSPYSSVTVRDGLIQFDSAETSIESLVKMCDSASCTAPNGLPHTNGFTLTGTQIHGGGSITWTGTCQWTSTGICIEGDNSTQDAVIGPYSYWTGSTFGAPNGTQFLPGLQNLIQFSGSFPPPTCNATTPQEPVCVTDATSCSLNNPYSSGGSSRCRLSCGGITGWRASGIGC